MNFVLMLVSLLMKRAVDCPTPKIPCGVEGKDRPPSGTSFNTTTRTMVTHALCACGKHSPS